METYDDDVTGRHADGANDEYRFAAELVDVHNSRDGGEEHGDTDDAGGQERDGVGRHAEFVEDLRGVVQDGVDTLNIVRESCLT